MEMEIKITFVACHSSRIEFAYISSEIRMLATEPI